MEEQENPQKNSEELEAQTPVCATPIEEAKPAQALIQAPSHLPDDKFSKARIVKFFPQSRYGFVKDKRGKDIYFNVDELRFIGDRGRESIREGAWVGYDVGWTSHGLHVNRMKIY